MKFMNNHYGQSLIFGKRVRCIAPDMGDGADEGADPGVPGGASDAPDADDADGADDSPSVDDLKTQLAKAKADYQRLKIQSDKAAKEAKQYKEQARARMSAEAQAQEAQAEKEAAYAEAIKELRTIKYSKRLIGIGMDESQADEMANVIPDMGDDADAFFDALGNFVDAIKKSSGDAAVQKLLKDRPEINAGGGDSDKDDPAMAFAKKMVESQKNANKGTTEDILKNFY